MKRAEIEQSIGFIQLSLSRAWHPADLKDLNKTLEGLIMMDADDDPPLGWLYEDRLPDGYPYDEQYENSQIISGVRMFPRLK